MSFSRRASAKTRAIKIEASVTLDLIFLNRIRNEIDMLQEHSDFQIDKSDIPNLHQFACLLDEYL